MKTFAALLVGAGKMGRAWAQTLGDCDRVRTVGWVDNRPGAAAEAIENLKLSAVTAYDDLGQALAQQRPDFVLNVTSPDAHVAVTLAALKAGAAVLSEKPMADSLTRARKLIAAGEKAGKLLMVSQSRRYHAGAVAFRQLIRDHLGGLGILNSDFFLGAHFDGFRNEMENVLLLDMASHNFDSARFFSGQEPISVYCEQFNPSWSWYKGADSAVAIFEMTGGLRYTYRGSWCADGLPTSWESQWRAHGPRGAATWDGETAPIAARVTGDKDLIRDCQKITATPPDLPFGGIAGSLREFLDALETGRRPQGECHDNIKSLAMVFADVESAQTGKRVKVRG